ncbi:MAG: hypothetical protein GXP39_09395 [Chloroflexi bacterium]|nr:hypothetical protein [Chloroflexota bacterium]
MGAAGSNRAALIGLGGWGCRVLAHLWPRLRQADERRALVTSNLTPIHYTVSFALVMPDDDHQLTIARPRPGRWDTPEFSETPWHALSDLSRGGQRHSRAWREETYRRLQDAIDVLEAHLPPEGNAGVGRMAMLRTLIAHESAIAQQLVWIMDQARIDRGEPTAEIAKLTIYILASLAEDIASVLIWPLAAMIRQAVGTYTPIEVVGLLQADSFASSPERFYELAGVHLALHEMAVLESSDPEQQDAVRASLPRGQWLEALGTHPLDYRYLISREKIGGTTAEGEGEIITMIGNALEAFLLSDVDRCLSERLAPDLPALHERNGYSSLGAASVYVPVDQMRARSRDQVRLRVLRDHFLTPLVPEQARQVEELAHTLGRDLLSVVRLEQALIGSGPIELDKDTWHPLSDDVGPFVPVRLRESELQPPLSGTEGLGPVARLEFIQQHFDQLEGARLPRWRQELLVRAGVIPTPDAEDLADAREEPEQPSEAQADASESFAEAPSPGQTAVHHLLDQVDRFLLGLVREGGRGGLRMAIHCAERVAELVQQDSVGLSAQRSQMAIPPALRNLSTSTEVNRLTRLMESWSQVQSHPGWVFLISLVLSLVAGTAAARANGMGPGELQAAGLVWLVVSAVVLGVIVGASVLVLARNQLDRLTNRLMRAKAAVINRQLNDLVYELTVNAHAALHEQILARVGYLQRTLAELEREQAQLAAALARPMTAESSFVRSAILDSAIYDGIWARAQRWISGDIAPRLWTNGNGPPDELLAAWRDTLEGVAAEPTLAQLGQRPALSYTDETGARTPLAEAISGAVARYAAMVSQPYLPPGASVESSLMRLAGPHDGEGKHVDAGWQLDDLCVRARPFIGLEETEHDIGAVVSIDLAAVPYTMSQWLGRETGAALHVHPVPSSDPFSIIVVRTLHGLLRDHLPQLRRYATAFQGLNAEERSRLIVSPILAGEPPAPEDEGQEVLVDEEVEPAPAGEGEPSPEGDATDGEDSSEMDQAADEAEPVMTDEEPTSAEASEEEPTEPGRAASEAEPEPTSSSHA